MMELITALFGSSRAFEKAVMISKLSDGIRESTNHEDLFMVYSNSSNYRIVDMCVCKCSCPSDKICSHIISILIKYNDSKRHYLIRILALKQLERLKNYSSPKQKEEIKHNLCKIFHKIASKSDIIESASSLIVGLYHRFLSKFDEKMDIFSPNISTEEPNQCKKPEGYHKATQCYSSEKPYKLGFIASLNHNCTDHSGVKDEILNSIRSYNSTCANHEIDCLDLNRACRIYSKLSSSKYIAINPTFISSKFSIDIKQLVNIIKLAPPLVELNSALNWKLNFYPSFGPLLEFITSHLDGHYLVTSHKTIYLLKIVTHNYHSLLSLIDNNVPVDQLASTVIYLLWNEQIGPYIEHLQQLFTNCELDTLLNFISVIPSEIIDIIYQRFLGNILYNINLTVDTVEFNKNLVVNLYIAYKMGYLSHPFQEIIISDTDFNLNSVNDIIQKFEHKLINTKPTVSTKSKKKSCESKLKCVTNTPENGENDNISVLDTNEAKCHIEFIRRDKYGIGLSDSTADKISHMQENRLIRIIDKLSSNLYSNNNQILYELIQNADDNQYPPETVPELIIVQTDTSLTLFNNEFGFAKADVEAICDLANSNKADCDGFYTGKFGIGFKSVFKITNEPHIVSNSYQFKFTCQGINKLIPQWIDNIDFVYQISVLANINNYNYNTIIHLPLVAPIHFDINQNLLLNLKKIRKLNLIKITSDEIKCETSLTVTDQLISDSQLTLKSVLYNEKAFKYVFYSDPELDIQLAFPFENVGQFVYSTLPIGNFGLNFAINSNFNLTLDRSSILDEQHNQSLVEQIPCVFIKALIQSRNVSRQIFFSVLSTFPRNAIGIFSPLNFRFNEFLNQLEIIPTVDGNFVKPLDSIYLSQINGNDSQLSAVEVCLKQLISKGYVKSFIVSDDFPHNLAMVLNLPACDFWSIILLFEQFTKPLDFNDFQDTISLLKIIQFFTVRHNNMKSQLFGVVGKYIKFPYIKNNTAGCDWCNKIYVGEPKICKNMFQLLPLEISTLFSKDFLIDIGFLDSRGTLEELINLADIQLPDDIKFSISVEIIKSIDGVLLEERHLNLPIYGHYIDDPNTISSLPLDSCDIILGFHDFYEILAKFGCKLFIPKSEYPPNLSQLLLSNNIDSHLKYLLNFVQLDTGLALEYFKFIKFVLCRISNLNSNIDLAIGDIPVPVGKWTVSNGKLDWDYHHLDKINNTNSIKYFTKTPPEVINKKSMPPANLMLLLKFLLKGDVLCQTHHIIQSEHLLLDTIGNMWRNRSNKAISDALGEVLDIIYNQLSREDLSHQIINELKESSLIFTKFEGKFTPLYAKQVYIDQVDGLDLPVQGLSQVFTANKSLWKELGISDTPLVDFLVEILNKNSSLTIKSIVSTVVYLYRHMDTDKFAALVTNLNIIPGWHASDRNKEVEGKITLIKPSEIRTIAQCANLNFFALDKLQDVWYKIIASLTNINFNDKIQLEDGGDCGFEYETCSGPQISNLQTVYQNEYKIKVGLYGERIVYEFLVGKYGDCVRWVNESGEQGLPYDITFFKDGVEKFVEVKSSSSATRKVFEISHSEWLFAQIKGDDFLIYRVNSVNSENPLINILPNPYSLWKGKKIAFCLSL